MIPKSYYIINEKNNKFWIKKGENAYQEKTLQIGNYNIS